MQERRRRRRSERLFKGGSDAQVSRKATYSPALSTVVVGGV